MLFKETASQSNSFSWDAALPEILVETPTTTRLNLFACSVDLRVSLLEVGDGVAGVEGRRL